MNTFENDVKAMTKCVVVQYIETLLWTETNEEGDPLDYTFSSDDISLRSAIEIYRDCYTFVRKVMTTATLFDGFYDMCFDESDLGHNFLLTRNSHGTGFWDRDFEGHEDGLDEIAKSFSECGLYEGDDGKLYYWNS